MLDILTQLYYMIDESLPVIKYPDKAERALEATFTPEQEALWEEYRQEDFEREDEERRILFHYLVKLGLHIP